MARGVRKLGQIKWSVARLGAAANLLRGSIAVGIIQAPFLVAWELPQVSSPLQIDECLGSFLSNAFWEFSEDKEIHLQFCSAARGRALFSWLSARKYSSATVYWRLWHGIQEHSPTLIMAGSGTEKENRSISYETKLKAGRLSERWRTRLPLMNNKSTPAAATQ
jgi:hypothetical protein